MRQGLYLTSIRPSPTTISYTVSTANPNRTLPARIFHRTTLFLRLLLSCVLLLALTWKLLAQQDTAKWCSLATHPISLPVSLPTPLSLCYSFQAQSWSHTLVISLAALYVFLRRYHTEESLLVLRSLGIQTRTLSPFLILPSKIRFIRTSQVRDIFIYEAFRGFEVRYYLAVVVDGAAELVVVYPTLLPGRPIVEEVWRGARNCLYEPDGRK